jgi:hypothetical protein
MVRLAACHSASQKFEVGMTDQLMNKQRPLARPEFDSKHPVGNK